MTVTLVHSTPDAERLIVRMARVSNPANQDNDTTAPRLLRYLIRHQHWSPFEMASLCVEIQTERDIAAQILRHRSFSFQEFSTRYAITDRAKVPHFRRQDQANRQASHDDLPDHVQESHQLAADEILHDVYALYWDMIGQGVARETARRILPLCTPTVMYMHGTIRSWIHYLMIRTDEATQLEHRQIALACLDVFREQFPVIAEAVFDG